MAQAPNIAWQNRIGGSNINLCYSSQQTTDGGFVVGGESNSNISGDKTQNSRGQYDYWIVKANSNGVVQWDKTIGGASPNGFEQDSFSTLKQTQDGGYVLFGHSDAPISGDKTENPVGMYDFWVVKTDANGNIQWQNSIGGTNVEEAYSIIQTSDGGYLLGGQSQSGISGDKSQASRGLQDYWVVKLSSTGVVEWDKTIGGNGNDILYSLIQLDSGNYIVAGQSNSNISGDKTENSKGSHDYWILQLNSDGDILWQKTIGGSGYDQATTMQKTSNTTFLIAGVSASNISGDKTENCRGFDDYWVLEMDITGSIIWQKTIGGNQVDDLHAVIKCADGNYLLSGSSASGISGDKTAPLYGLGGYDAWLVKINNAGNILWQKTIGSSGDDGFNAVFQTGDSGYFLSGVTTSPLADDVTEAPIGAYDYWIMKLEPDNLSIPENTGESMVVYPNPTTGTITVNLGQDFENLSLTVYNVIGQELSKSNFAQFSEKQIEIDGPNGVYLLEIEVKGQIKKTFRIIKK